MVPSLRPLRRLQWRLTLSFVLVTTIATMTFTIAIALLTFITLQPYTSPPPFGDTKLAAASLQQTALYIDIVPYLGQASVDRHFLTARLGNLTQPSPPINAKGNATPTAAPAAKPLAAIVAFTGAGNTMPTKALSVAAPGAGFPDQPDTLIVLDLSGHVLAAVTRNGNSPTSILTLPATQAAIQATQAGIQAVKQTTFSLPDGASVAATLLYDYNNQPIGVLIGTYVSNARNQAAYAKLNSQQQVIAQVVDQVVPPAILFLLLSSALGTLAGVLFSRRLARRLQRITLAAQAWSRGEFAVHVRDTIQDEVGLLAQTLDQMAREIQSLLIARQELAIVEERHRLARDLHDSIKQQLFVMAMLVGAARAQTQAQDQQQALLSLDGAERITRRAHQELTALIYALRPVTMIGQTFPEMLRELITTWAQSTTMATQIALDADLSIPADLGQTLLLVTQEALANVARHSDATLVTVALTAVTSAIALTISDNGHGFGVQEEPGRGMGLQSMQERVAQWGGSFTISSESTGTTIVAVLPYPDPQPLKEA